VNTGLVLDYDAQTLVIPVMAMAAALLDMRTEGAEEVLAGLERLGNVMLASVRAAGQTPQGLACQVG
jgi:hypothetical protein